MKQDKNERKLFRIGHFTLVPTDYLKEERARVEEEYHELNGLYQDTKEKLFHLECQNRELTKKLDNNASLLESLRSRYYNDLADALSPANAMDLYDRCCSGGINFKRFHEDRDTGVVFLEHDRSFFPTDTIAIPRGATRTCDQSGRPVDLVQPRSYNSILWSQHGHRLLPTRYQPSKTRILFGVARNDGFWLRDPRYATDVILEIWAHYDGESCSFEEKEPNLDSEEIVQWRSKYGGIIGHSSGSRVFTFIASFEEYLNSGKSGSYSQRQIEAIRERCYAEYLDFYFNDKNLTDAQ